MNRVSELILSSVFPVASAINSSLLVVYLSRSMGRRIALNPLSARILMSFLPTLNVPSNLRFSSSQLVKLTPLFRYFIAFFWRSVSISRSPSVTFGMTASLGVISGFFSSSFGVSLLAGALPSLMR